MPKPTHTPIRSVRVPDDTWADLAEVCKAAGTDRSAVVLALVDELLLMPDRVDVARLLVAEPEPAATA